MPQKRQVQRKQYSFLIFFSVEPDKTHNLVALIKELAKHTEVPEEVNETAILNNYAVQTRYPGSYSPINEDEYNNAIMITEKCVSWVDKKINELLKKEERK